MQTNIFSMPLPAAWWCTQGDHDEVTENWLFGDYDSAMKALGGGYYEQFKPRMYRHWVKNCWNIVHHRQVMNSLNCFIESGDLRLDARHV